METVSAYTDRLKLLSTVFLLAPDLGKSFAFGVCFATLLNCTPNLLQVYDIKKIKKRKNHLMPKYKICIIYESCLSILKIFARLIVQSQYTALD